MRLVCLLVAVAACGSSSGSGPDASSDAIVTDMAPPDSGFTACEGACRTNTLSAAFMVTRELDRAYYGVTTETNPPSTMLHVEAYRGGGTGCPTRASLTPAYTLVLGQVAVPSDATPSSSPGNILDYVGDLLGGPVGAAATQVTITPVAYQPGQFVAFDAAVTFASGTVTGHAFATHCDSLDSPP